MHKKERKATRMVRGIVLLKKGADRSFLTTNDLNWFDDKVKVKTLTRRQGAEVHGAVAILLKKSRRRIYGVF